MNFLNPIFLLSLAAVAVPVLIHIFSRRRVPEVPFSTIRFLRPSDRRSMVRVNLRRLLLLALRVLGIALVALAFARPVVRGGLASLFPKGGSRAACFLLDRSFSMGVEGDEGTVFERAKVRLAEALGRLESGDEATIVLFDTGQEVIFSGTFERGAALASLRSASTSWAATDLRSAVAAGRRILDASRRDVRELYVVSDFQRSGIGAGAGPPAAATSGAASAAAADAKAADSTASARPIRAFIVPVRGDGVSNASVERLLAPRVTLHRGEIAPIKIVFRNASRDLEARFPYEISVDGRRILEREAVVPPGGSITETAPLAFERAGWIEGTVRKRPDRLAADDSRHFALRVREKLSVLLVGDAASFYVEQALSPEGAEGDIALARRDWRSFSSADLARAEVVVLGPGRGPLPGDIDVIGRFVAGGGRAVVLVVPALEEAVRALSAFAPRVEWSEMERGYYTIAKPEAPPALLAPFDDSDLRSLGGVRLRSVPLVRGVPERAVSLVFSTGTPFVWEEAKGAGRIVFAGVDPRPEAGDLVLSPFFLPLMQQLVLTAGPDPPAGEGSLVGEELRWRGGELADVACELPDGSRLRPLSSDGAVVIPPVESPGFVRIVEGGARAEGGAARGGASPGRGGAGEPQPPAGAGETVGVIAVNPDCRRESDLSVMSGGEAADSLGLRHSLVIGEHDAVAGAIRSAREGTEVALALLVAAIMTFVAEAFVAQRERQEG